MADDPERWWVLPFGGNGDRPAFAFSCLDMGHSAGHDEFWAAYREFMWAVEDDLGGVKTGEADGPYSTVILATLRGVPVVITLDSDLLIVRASDPKHDHATESLACAILAALRRRAMSA